MNNIFDSSDMNSEDDSNCMDSDDDSNGMNSEDDSNCMDSEDDSNDIKPHDDSNDITLYNSKVETVIESKIKERCDNLYNPSLNNKKYLVMFATHINTQFRLNNLKESINYFTFDCIDIVVINSKNLNYNSNLNKYCNERNIKYYEIENDFAVDFGKWYYLLTTKIDYNNYDYIIFTNDSFIIESPITHFINLLSKKNVEIYGYSDSTEEKYHYQSYLFGLNKNSIPLFLNIVVSKKHLIKNANDVIQNYELKLCHYFKSNDCFLKIGNILDHKGKNIFFRNDKLYDELNKNKLLPFIKLKKIKNHSHYITRLNFDYDFYVSEYNDLKSLNEERAYNHWITYGEKEGRKCFSEDINFNFDYKFYIDKYPDVQNLTKKEAYNHWINFGKKEGRICLRKKVNFKTRITIIIHLFYTELFNEFLKYIKNVTDVFNIVNVIFTININSTFDKTIYKINPDFIVVKVENKGTDIHPFLESIKYIRNNNIGTDFILKLHSKLTNNLEENYTNWRKDLILPITNYSNLLYLQHYFLNMKNIGYVGSQKCSLPKSYDLDFYQNIEGVNNISKQFPHLEKDWTDFNGGNMFWISNDVLNEYLTNELIDYLTTKFSVGKPPCNLSDKGIYVEYLCERLFTGLFCYKKTNILVNNLISDNNISRGFYNPRIFNFITPINLINSSFGPLKILYKSVVIYTYFNSPSSNFNLKFFASTELKERDDIDYIIVINGFNCEVNIPTLKNLHIIRRENIGYDFGGHKSALDYISENNKSYNYYFFMNSGVIGPILREPTNCQHWSNIFINKITDIVKLVGTTIVCLPHTDLGGYGPKVEGFFFMTDRIGLNLLKDEETIFYDHPEQSSCIIKCEYELSNCILKNGYSIDCMLNKYQGIDWTNDSNWNLNNNIHPSRKNSFYGKSIDPYEVIFHKWYWHGKEYVNKDIIDDYINKYPYSNS